MTLTKRTTDILTYIAHYISQHQYGPTIRDIQRAVGVKSTSTVTYHLDKLEMEGLIFREHGATRGISMPGTRQRDDALVLIFTGVEARVMLERFGPDVRETLLGRCAL